MDKTKNNRILIWIPRVLAIMFILFISIFAFDSFSGDIPLSQSLIGFMIHLIPSFILLSILIIAWKHPRIGGWVFILAGIALSMFWGTYREVFRLLILTLPMLATGVLFMVSGHIPQESN